LSQLSLLENTPAAEGITQTRLCGNITHAIGDVFKVMLAREARLISPAENTDLQQGAPSGKMTDSDRPHVVGTVGFLGDIDGCQSQCQGS
jgi:hypothetical protein